MKSLINLFKKVFQFVTNRVDSTIERNTTDTDRILAHRNNLEGILADINHKTLDLRQQHTSSEDKVKKLKSEISERKRLYKAATTENQKNQIARLIQIDAKTLAIHEERLEAIAAKHENLAAQHADVQLKFQNACADYNYARELEALGELEGSDILSNYDSNKLLKDISDIELVEIKHGSSTTNEVNNLELSEFRKQLDAE